MTRRLVQVHHGHLELLILKIGTGNNTEVQSTQTENGDGEQK